MTHVFLYDFAHRTETQLTKDAEPDRSLKFSPDGKSLAFVRNDKELRVVDLDSKQEQAARIGICGRVVRLGPGQSVDRVCGLG